MSPLDPEVLLRAGAAVSLLMVGVWAWSVPARDASLIDRWWGPGFVLFALVTAAAQHATDARDVLVMLLVAIWGLRLGVHITLRNRRHAGEDPRYAAMRARAPRSFAWTSLVTVFLLQAVLLSIVALPLHAALHPGAPAGFTPWDALGAALWLTGFLFESVGDAQLAAFQRDPANRGRVLDHGLWRWTRHPNYFGDACVWCGFGLLGAQTPGAWWTLIGPALMLLFLTRVSGVTLTESAMRSRPGYAEYIARTSAFLPWPPKRGAAPRSR